MSFFNYFTDTERGSVGKATRLKNRVFGGAGPLLCRLHVYPDALSYVGLSLLIGVVIWFVSHPYRSIALIALYIVIDGLDGSYARFLNRPTQSGAFTDIVADQLGMVTIALGFIQYGMVDGVVGAYYIVIYLVMITFSVIQNAQGIPMQYILRTKYILYGIYALWAFSGINLAPALLPAFCLVMTFSAAQSYLRLKRGLYWKYDLPKILAQDRRTREADQRPPVFWPSLNFILPALVVLILLFAGAYTQTMALLERADTRPEWQSVELEVLKGEELSALAAAGEGWLVSTYNPQNRFSRVISLDRNFRQQGAFRLPWALHHDHGLCADGDKLYIADRLSRRVFELDLPESRRRGIGVLDASFDTTLTAPVACALIELDGHRRLLVAEFMNDYKTLAIDYQRAFTAGSAEGAVVGWYRNSGFVHGLAAAEGRTYELHGSFGEDIVYEFQTRDAFAHHWIRSAIARRIACPPWKACGLALGPRRLAVVDKASNELYYADVPGL